MSASQTSPQSPIQIHPVAELQETLVQLGFIRNRNLILATENYMLKQRMKEMEASAQALQETIDGLHYQMAEAREKD